MEKFRTFESWSTRDSAENKLEYKDYIHPLCDFSFAEYMQSKQYIGGKKRSGSNWQLWIPQDSLIDSLTRHMEILKLLEKGHRVVEYKLDGKTYLKVDLYELPIGAENVDWKSKVSECNAIRFNSEGYKLGELKEIQKRKTPELQDWQEDYIANLKPYPINFDEGVPGTDITAYTIYDPMGVLWRQNFYYSKEEALQQLNQLQNADKQNVGWGTILPPQEEKNVIQYSKPAKRIKSKRKNKNICFTADSYMNWDGEIKKVGNMNSLD